MRRAWLERKERATSAKEELRWKRRTAKLGRKPAFRKIEAPAKGPAEVPKERIPEAGPQAETKAPEFPKETPPGEKTEIPRALFPE